MEEPTSLFRTDGPAPTPQGLSTALPPDLLEQVRGRVRLLALFLFIGFAFDLVAFLVEWATAALAREPLPPDFFAYVPFQWVYLGAATASAALAWAAGSRRVSPSRLHVLGLAYEILICFVIAVASAWQYFLDHGTLPNLSWVPTVVVLFPLIMPGPPRRMLVTTMISASMSPLGILLLDQAGKVRADANDYGRAIVSAALATVFAHMGARIVYRLGREVVTAREMGSYHLEAPLGRGGMGEVWRARHRMLARPAAIKLIRPQLLRSRRGDVGDELRSRFTREAQAIAGLRSPHTVGLYDFGVSDRGAFFLVMELLDGLDTDRLVRKFGPMPSERAIHVLRQMCHSLSEAHSRGLVHRDIKPANVFLCRYGEECDFVKVLDFGLVKTFEDGRDPEPALTREDMVHGTPAFIAPEQAMGRSDLDGRVDVYAAGCVAYWLLTGQNVFTAANSMALIWEHIHSVPAPPSSRTELPIAGELDRLVLACLAKDPRDRPATARELDLRLAGLANGGEWTEARAREWWDRHLPIAP